MPPVLLVVALCFDKARRSNGAEAAIVALPNEHRAHICTIISQLGMEPPDVTGWGYMEATGEFQESKLDQ